jgi:hypothetical protein
MNDLKIIQCDFLDFCFRFRLSQLKCSYDKNYKPLYALLVGKPEKSAVYPILVLPTVHTHTHLYTHHKCFTLIIIYLDA